MRSSALENAGTRASGTGREIAVDVLFAVGAATGALAVRLLMDAYLGTRLPFLPFLGAVVAAARYRGKRAGFLTAGLGLVAVFWLRGDAFGSIEAFGSVGFALVSVLVIEWIDQLHLLHRRVEQQNAALQKDSMERDAAKRDERAHRDRLRLTLLSIGDGVLVTDANGQIELLNPVAEQLTGWSTHDARNRPLNDVFALVDRNSGEPVDAPIASAMDQHRKTSLPRFTSLKHRDGRLIPIEDSIAPMIEDSGAVSGSIVVFRDISARLESESALRDSEARFRMIADNIAPLAWTADAEGRPTWFNRRWYEFTGITPGLLDRQEWVRRIHPEHVDRVVTTGNEALRRGTLWESTFPLRGADGEYRWFLSRLVPIADEDGNTVRWFGTNTDVTDRVRMEESLRDADRRKDEFVATLAHELRNPLAPLQHAVQLLDTAEAVAAPRELVHVMQRQVTQMSRMVDDLIDLSLGGRQVLQLRRQLVNVEVLVRDAVEMVRPLAVQHGHHLEVALPEEPSFLFADAPRLTQALTNVLRNACKFTPDGGCISIAVEGGTDRVCLSVTDTGIGIASDRLRSVFDMFSQGHDSWARADGGLGIGLTLAKLMIEMHGGQIEARSAGENLGSTFEIQLPRAEAPIPEPSEPPPSDQLPPSLRRVLVADDNIDSADTLALLIASHGFEVITVYDGEAAIAAFEQHRPDLVFLDIGMPKVSGHEACRAIRARSGPDATLIALTGWGQSHDRALSHEAGFDLHLVKPVEHETLVKILQSGVSQVT